MTEQVVGASSPPLNPRINDSYYDDGSNTASGNPGWMFWSGAAWADSAGGGGGVDTTAIHKTTANEIALIPAKATAVVSGDFLLIEDSEDGNAKNRITVGDLPGGGGVDTTAIHKAINAEIDGLALLTPTVLDIVLIEDESSGTKWAKGKATVQSIIDLASGGGVAQWNASQTDRVVYVTKDGSDSNDGSTINLAMLTVAAARDHAVLLTPTVDDRVVVLIHPGVYAEWLSLGSDDRFISFIGVGGPKAVAIENISGNTAICFIDCSTSTQMSIDIQGIHFRARTADALDATPLAVGGDAKNVVFRDCIFTARDKGTYLRGDSITDVTLDFYDCVFEQELANDTCLDVSLVTANFFNCRMEGRVFTGTSGAVLATFHSCVGRGSLSGFGIWQISDGTTLLDCDIENESGNSNSAAIRVEDVSGVVVNGGRAFCGSGSDESITSVSSGTLLGGSGTYMNHGFSSRIRRRNNDPNIIVQTAGPGVDFYLELGLAVTANNAYGGVVHLTDDVVLTVDIDIDTGPITIDGGGQFAISMATPANDMFRQDPIDPCKLVLRNVELTNGVIDWNYARAGELVLDHCTGGVTIFIDNFLSGKSVRLNDCLIVAAVTDKPVIDVSDAVTPILIRNSYLQGNSSSIGAIDMNADNSEIDIAYCDIVNAANGVDPITNPTIATTIRSHHNRYSSDPFLGANLANFYTTPYDMIGVI